MRLRRRQITSEPDRSSDIGTVMAAHQRAVLMQVRTLVFQCRDGYEDVCVARIRELLDPKPVDISEDIRPVIRNATMADRSHVRGVPNEIRPDAPSPTSGPTGDGDEIRRD